jgi:hypothetical protein
MICRLIGTLTVPCKGDESVTLKLEFGATEIMAMGSNAATGEKVDAKLSYA